MKNGRRAQAEQMPLPRNREKYGTLWETWWQSVQPTWRGKALAHTIPSSGDWAPLLCGGANGLVLVILALAWWMQADSESGNTDPRITVAIDDVSWALVNLRAALAGNRGNGEKRGPDGSAEKQRATKRYA